MTAERALVDLSHQLLSEAISLRTATQYAKEETTKLVDETTYSYTYSGPPVYVIPSHNYPD